MVLIFDRIEFQKLIFKRIDFRKIEFKKIGVFAIKILKVILKKMIFSMFGLAVKSAGSAFFNSFCDFTQK